MLLFRRVTASQLELLKHLSDTRHIEETAVPVIIDKQEIGEQWNQEILAWERAPDHLKGDILAIFSPKVVLGNIYEWELKEACSGI